MNPCSKSWVVVVYSLYSILGVPDQIGDCVGLEMQLDPDHLYTNWYQAGWELTSIFTGRFQLRRAYKACGPLSFAVGIQTGRVNKKGET